MKFNVLVALLGATSAVKLRTQYPMLAESCPGADCSDSTAATGTSGTAAAGADCPAGYYYNGSACADVADRGTSGTAASGADCPAGYYYNGSACTDVANRDTAGTAATGSCPGVGCSDSTAATDSTGTPPSGASCPTGMYRNGADCYAE